VDNDAIVLQTLRHKFPTHEDALREVIRLRGVIARNRVLFEELRATSRELRARVKELAEKAKHTTLHDSFDRWLKEK